jgi:hypothetical protein
LSTSSRATSNPLVWAAALSLALLLGVGCKGSPPPTGAANVTVAGSALTSGIARVVLTIGAGDGPAFADIVQPLAATATGWSAFVTGIPAGPGRSFRVDALDASGTPVLTGSAKATIVAGQAATVVIVLNPAGTIAYQNSAPLIDFLSASQSSVDPGGVVLLQTHAHDPDAGDTITYSWTATCGTFDDPHATSVTWTAPAAGSCQLTLTVADNHGASVSMLLAVNVVAPGGEVLVTAQVAGTGPVISAMTVDARYGTTLDGDLTVSAIDTGGSALGYAWSTTCSGVNIDTATPYAQTAPHFTGPVNTAPCSLTVTVTSAAGASIRGVIVLSASPSLNVAPVIANTFQPNADLLDPRRPVVVQPGDAVALAVNAYDPEGQDLAFAWTATAGQLDPSLDKTTSPGSSSVLFHVPRPLPAGTTVTVAVRDPGGLVTTHVFYFELSSTTGDPCAGVTCTASDLCHVPGVCAAGVGICSAEAPKTCPTGQACDLADGLCKPPPDLCAGVTCTASDLCHIAGTCQPGTGTCSAQTPVVCATGTCDLLSGACVPRAGVPSWQAGRDLPVSGPVGLTMDTSGNAYMGGGIFSLSPLDFDGHSVASLGDSDILLARYDATAHATWAVSYGDATNAQFAVGTAVTNDGTVAVIGSFTGGFSIGTGSLSSASAIDFLAAVKATDGTGLWAKQFSNGTNGLLKAVAANPSDASLAHGNRIAVCGFANSGTPANLVGTGAVAAAANDIVIAAFKSDGTKLWGSQFSSPGTANEECDAVAIDDNGDVWAAGSTSGASINLGGATGVLTGPNASTRKFIWVAKFNGATGAAITSAIFGGTGGQATPAGIAVDALGNVALAGQFTGNVTFGGTTLTSAGLADAWAARLGGALVPAWAVRMGGAGGDVANGVAVDSAGDVLVVGSFNKGPTTGAAVLTAAGTTSPDVFVLKLNGATGATDFAAGYGDAVNQTGDAIAVNRFGATPDQIAVAGTLNGSIGFPAPVGTLSFGGVDPSLSADVFLVTGQIR